MRIVCSKCLSAVRCGLIVFVAAGGCKRTETQFEVVSFRSASPEIYREHFDDGYYCENADNKWTFVFDIKPVLVQAMGQPADDGAATSQPTSSPATRADEELWMSQVIEVEVFWRPRPGTSFAESSQTNANIVYSLTTGAGTITYEGAGFVYFSPSMDKKRMEGRIESATLYPARTVKEQPDLFGPSG